MLHDSGSVYEFGPFCVEIAEGRLVCAGESLRIPPKAFDLLALLVQRAGHTISKDDLMATLWPDTFVEEGNLKVHISTLRKVLDDGSGRQWIETVPRRGYRFSGPVREVAIGPGEAPRPIEPPSAPAPPGTISRIVPVRLVTTVAALVLVAAGAAGLLSRRSGSSPVSVRVRSVLVMPFDSASAGNRDRYLRVGLPGALVARLSTLRGFRLVPPAAAGPHEDAFAAARRLGVDAVLTGIATSDDRRVHVTIALTRVSDRSIIWSGDFERDASEMIAIENEIAEQVARRVAPALSGAERAEFARHETPNGNAYVLYLRGLDQWEQRTPQAIRTAIAMFEQAIHLDPGFALACAGLADAYAVTVSGLPPATRFPLARTAANRALSLDQGSAEAHTALAFLDYKADWRWADADREFRRAIALNPEYALARHWYGEFLGLMGQYDEAKAQFRVARRLDPYSMPILVDDAAVFVKAGDWRAGAELIDEGLKAQPDSPRLNREMASILAGEGNVAASVAYDLKARRLGGESPNELRSLQHAFEIGGIQAYRREYLHLLLARKGRAGALPFGYADELANVYASLHDRANTMKWLLAATANHENSPLLLNAPDYAFLARDPEFEALRQRVGLSGEEASVAEPNR